MLEGGFVYILRRREKEKVYLVEGDEMKIIRMFFGLDLRKSVFSRGRRNEDNQDVLRS